MELPFPSPAIELPNQLVKESLVVAKAYWI